jgi:hypothetical protein
MELKNIPTESSALTNIEIRITSDPTKDTTWLELAKTQGKMLHGLKLAKRPNKRCYMA